MRSVKKNNKPLTNALQGLGSVS